LEVPQSDVAIAAETEMKEVKYCAIIGCAGREKFKENEYSTEPR